MIPTAIPNIREQMAAVAAAKVAVEKAVVDVVVAVAATVRVVASASA